MAAQFAWRTSLLMAAATLMVAVGGFPSPSRGASTKADAPPAAAKAETPTTKLELNTASEERLQELPGIGPAYAKKIVAGRPYKSVKELSKSGIPAATVEKILPLVTVKSVEKPAEKKSPSKAAGAASESVPPEKQAAQKSPETTRKSEDTTRKAADSTPVRTPPKKGMVWVNTESQIYHKEDSRWYGKTKEGKWMTEADAIKEGNRAAKE